LKVVIVNDYAYVNGGASKVAITSAKALAKQGLSVHFFAATGPTAADLLGTANLTVTCLDTIPYNQRSGARGLVPGLWDRAAAIALRNVLQGGDSGSTVVHLHSSRDSLSSSVLAAAFRAGVPVIYTAHEYGLACPYACFYDYGQEKLCTRKPLGISCLTAHCNRKGFDKKVWMSLRQVVQDKVARVPARISDAVFVSEFSREILEPYIGRKVRRHTLANPMSVRENVPRRVKPESPFLFVGLLTPGKDPVLAARAARKLGAPIRFVGDGELREAILEANPAAVITGWLSPDEVLAEMMNARALVLPTRWYEVQPLAVHEAAACGLPAIVSRVCAASEFIEDGVNGLLSNPGDVEDLATEMAVLMDDQKANEMGVAAHSRFWADPPTLEKHVNALVSIYEGALGHE
jgi:glycosyltransferase involved in cell wall biosynthesis